VIAVAGGAVVWRSVRRAAPQIESVTPHQVRAGERATLQIHGAGLRPYLSAYVVRAGEPFSLSDAQRYLQEAAYFVGSPSLAEIKCPPEMKPGAYDLYLYDEGQQVAVRRAAIDVAVPDLPRGVLTAKVRFFVADETIPLIQAGDRDQPAPIGANLPSPGGALVERVTVTNEKSDTLDMHLVDREQAWIGRRVQGRAVDVELKIPVVEVSPRAYQYTSLDLVQAGDIFTLSTRRYKLHGLVLWVSDVERGATIAPPAS
jgi:hypothetical protein